MREGDFDSAIIARLRGSLPPRRFVHSIGTAETATRIAPFFGADSVKARLAGLLHDCAKGIATDSQVAACDAAGVVLDEDTRNCAPVVHGWLGEAFARRDYGVEDQDVLRAIRLHTVGCAEMTPLDKTVWLADKIEPGRDYDGVEAIRAVLSNDPDGAIILCLAGQFAKHVGKRTPFHPGAVRFWNALLAGRES